MPRVTRVVAALLLVVLTAPAITAQRRAADDVGERSYENDGRWHRARCLAGVGYGAPLRLHASLALGARRYGADRSTCLFVAPQVGLGGAAVHTGAATTLGRWGSGVGVSGGAFRTFGDPRAALPWRTYAGARVHLWPVLGLHTSVGWYRALGTLRENDDRTLVAWSVGFGF